MGRVNNIMKEVRIIGPDTTKKKDIKPLIGQVREATKDGENYKVRWKGVDRIFPASSVEEVVDVEPAGGRGKTKSNQNQINYAAQGYANVVERVVNGQKWTFFEKAPDAEEANVPAVREHAASPSPTSATTTATPATAGQSQRPGTEKEKENGKEKVGQKPSKETPDKDKAPVKFEFASGVASGEKPPALEPPPAPDPELAKRCHTFSPCVRTTGRSALKAGQERRALQSAKLKERKGMGKLDTGEHDLFYAKPKRVKVRDGFLVSPETIRDVKDSEHAREMAQSMDAGRDDAADSPTGRGGVKFDDEDDTEAREKLLVDYKGTIDRRRNFTDPAT